jgi:hypothetical protein
VDWVTSGGRALFFQAPWLLTRRVGRRGAGRRRRTRRACGATLPVVRGRRSASWERVEAARRQARLALGKDPDAPNDYGRQPEPHASVSPPAAPAPIAHGPSIGVLTVGEAATRLGMSRVQLDAMIARGSVETLPIEFGCVVPTREVERLQGSRS